MEHFYLIIIGILVLKAVFWTIYCCYRANRTSQCENRSRVLVIRPQAAGARNQPFSDRSTIINHAEPISTTGPPPYAQTAKNSSGPVSPPYGPSAPWPQTTGMPSATLQGGQFHGAGTMPPPHTSVTVPEQSFSSPQ